MSKAIQFEDNGEKIYPIVSETINNENGTAIKFSDGTMICTKRIKWQGEIKNIWGSLFDSPAIDLGNYAYPFIDIPTISVINGTSSGGIIECVEGITNTSFGRAYICRGTVGVLSYVYILNCTAIGRWK